MLSVKCRIRGKFFMSFIQFIYKRVFYGQRKTDLIKKCLKTIVLEKFLVIWRVIIHAIQRFIKALYQQSPPAVAFAKIDGAVHSLHSIFLQPPLTKIEHKVSCLLIINTFKKAYTAGWLGIPRI